MAENDQRSDWHTKVIKPRLPWGAAHPRAAEVGEVLNAVMFSTEFALEDAEYQKIVPNEFVVELHEENYLRNYQPIEARVLQQWRTSMLAHLATVNNRQGRNYYQFSAPLQLEIHPVVDLKPTEMRILCRIHRPDDAYAKEPAMPCLEMVSSDKRWLLRGDIVTIGRDEHCNIYLDMPDIQNKRLISGEHAYLHRDQGRYTIFDGSTDGKASVNGSFVNRQSVPLGGHLLHDGDEIILASIDPHNPRSDTPGVGVLRFREVCN